jgi:hypothetical protein
MLSISGDPARGRRSSPGHVDRLQSTSRHAAPPSGGSFAIEKYAPLVPLRTRRLPLTRQAPESARRIGGAGSFHSLALDSPQRPRRFLRSIPLAACCTANFRGDTSPITRQSRNKKITCFSLFFSTACPHEFSTENPQSTRPARPPDVRSMVRRSCVCRIALERSCRIDVRFE